jgi:hypothetical protein
MRGFPAELSPGGALDVVLKKSAVTAITMVLDFAPIPIISQ